MKKLSLGTACTLVMLAATVGQAQVILDPLHGYCSVGCFDNGTNSPTGQNPITGFGFTASAGPLTGTFYIEVLVPNNEQTVGASYAITGTGTVATLPATATLFSPSEWSSGDLDTFLGISDSPNNPIGAYLPSTQFFDPGATGFSVYQANLGTSTLLDPSNPGVNPLLNITAIPIGSYIVGFLQGTSKGNVATANSGAIFETTSGGGPVPLGFVPEPSSIILLGTVALAACTIFRKKAQKRA